MNNEVEETSSLDDTNDTNSDSLSIDTIDLEQTYESPSGNIRIYRNTSYMLSRRNPVIISPTYSNSHNRSNNNGRRSNNSLSITSSNNSTNNSRNNSISNNSNNSNNSSNTSISNSNSTPSYLNNEVFEQSNNYNINYY